MHRVVYEFSTFTWTVVAFLCCAGVVASAAESQQRDLSGENCTVTNVAKRQAQMVGESYRRLQNGEISKLEFETTGKELSDIAGLASSDLGLACEKMARYRGTEVESPTVSVEDAALRPVMEASFERYREATRSGDVDRIKASMSSFAFGTLRNNVESAGLELTRSLIKEMTENVPDVGTMQFYRLFRNGPTVGIVYKGNPDAGEDDAKVNFAFIKLVKEGENWLFDGAARYAVPKYQENGREADFSLEDIASLGQETLLIDGLVRDAPAESPTSGVPLILDINSYGYATDIFINDELKASVSGAQRATRLTLPGGEHQVRIVVARTSEQASVPLSVIVQAQGNDGSYRNVLDFTPPADATGEYVRAITIEP